MKSKKASFVLLSFMMLFGFAACSSNTDNKKTSPAQSVESKIQISNPFIEVSDADAFKTLGITLDAPKAAQDVSYYIIGGEIAEVRFLLDGKNYLIRASAQEGDFSGLYGRESETEPVDSKQNADIVSVDIGSGIYHKITWSDGKINYCLYGTDGAEKDRVLSTYQALKK